MTSYVGATPLDTYSSLQSQHFTTSATTSYVLSQAVTNENDIRLYINNVAQQPGSSYAYTCSGTTLNLSSPTSATDTMYCVFVGKSIGTIAPPDGSVSDATITGMAASKLTGTVSDSQIAGLATSKLTGTISDSQIADMASSKLTGTIATARLGSGATSSTFLRGDQTYAEAGGGKLLQVVTTESISTGSTTSTSWASAGMTVTITPSATSSKVLLLCATAMYNNSTDFAGLTIFRGLVSSGIQVSAISNTSTWGFQAMRNSTSQSYYNQGMAITVVDAPATTSAQLYTLAVKSGAGNQIGINYGAGNTSLTAMEIGA